MIYPIVYLRVYGIKRKTHVIGIYNNNKGKTKLMFYRIYQIQVQQACNIEYLKNK